MVQILFSALAETGMHATGIYLLPVSYSTRSTLQNSQVDSTLPSSG